MNEKIIKRLANLFAYLAVRGEIAQDFMTIYAVIIAFYFGTQSQKTQDAIEKETEGQV